MCREGENLCFGKFLILCFLALSYGVHLPGRFCNEPLSGPHPGLIKPLRVPEDGVQAL